MIKQNKTELEILAMEIQILSSCFMNPKIGVYFSESRNPELYQAIRGINLDTKYALVTNHNGCGFGGFGIIEVSRSRYPILTPKGEKCIKNLLEMYTQIKNE